MDNNFEYQVCAAHKHPVGAPVLAEGLGSRRVGDAFAEARTAAGTAPEGRRVEHGPQNTWSRAKLLTSLLRCCATASSTRGVEAAGGELPCDYAAYTAESWATFAKSAATPTVVAAMQHVEEHTTEQHCAAPRDAPCPTPTQ